MCWVLVHWALNVKSQVIQKRSLQKKKKKKLPKISLKNTPSVQLPPFLSPNTSLNYLSPHCVCQTVVNFISELQEQMCRFQEEINSKIQGKQASEVPPDGSSSAVGCPEPTEDQLPSKPGPSCDRTSAVCLEGAQDGPNGSTDVLEEGSSEAEQQLHGVGTALPAWL